MSVGIVNEIYGKPILTQDGYTIHGVTVEGQLIVIGVYAADPEPLHEVRIPPVISGMKVRAIAGQFCGNEFERFSIGTLYIPDSVETVHLKQLKPAQLLLTKTDTPVLSLVNGLLLTADGSTVLTYADEALTRYVIPEGVESIGEEAFHHCGAEEIVLPQSLRVIGESAFYASRMRRMTLPAGLRKIEKTAFYRARLEEVVLPHGLQQIGESAFSQCNLRTVRVPGTVKWITWGAFSSCPHLTEVELEPGVEVIGSYAFEACSALQKVTLPQGMEKICGGAFRDCGRLSGVQLPQSVVSVADDAFEKRGFGITDEEECEKPCLTEAFAGQVVYETPEMTVCARREGYGRIITGMWHVRTEDPPEIRIPPEIDGLPVTGIQEDCVVDLGGWLSCSTLYLPDSLSLRSIPRDLGYSKLTLIPTQHPMVRMENGCLLSMDGKRMLASSDREAYVCAVPDGVEEIADGAFVHSYVREIILPQTLREIGDEAFCDATLRRMTLPQGVKRIGSAAFAETLLEDVVLPEGIEILGDKAFEGSLLRNLHLPDSLREVGIDVVKDCCWLERVRMPEGMEQLPESPEDATVSCDDEMLTAEDDMDILFSDSAPVLETDTYTIYGSTISTQTEKRIQIDAVAAGGAEFLAEVRIPDRVADCVVGALGSDWFAMMVRIGRLILPGSVCHIDRDWLEAVDEIVMESGDDAAYVIEDGFLLTKDRKMLMQQLRMKDAQVRVPDGVEKIAPEAFAGCMVEEITLPEAVRELPEAVFLDCTALAGVTLPHGLEKIGERAFRGCRALKTLTLPDTLTCLGQNALCDTGLTALHIPASLLQEDLFVFDGLNLTVAEDHPLFTVEAGALYSKDGETLLRWNGAEEAIVPAHVKRVAPHAFSNCRALNRVVLPQGLTEVDQFAFNHCRNLECVELPDGVKSLGAGCFNGCRSLTEIRLPEGLEEIGAGCFFGCLNLARLCVPQSVQRIGERAFRHCSALWELTLPDNLVRQKDGSYARA